ncbi:hypothetical protein CH063_12843 [Colletotrichum higginsianum]|uniref:Uncharacterized protein n=1 Tax=Colletotrichum higginsianum (strain IMI 349063) TaxID=759273 RepID=H1VS14_COLHI|nr:hypothetical protein CH63R_06833 [Colletotrichum higginsianum IMI 349063]OBR11141.1 hypothetical protein CH63R_06833 [Colletotrichum higginsianum IMI 349063]CCF43021.1 hypothetical protein CH063_12843 [Colletotrichum higginsianum]
MVIQAVGFIMDVAATFAVASFAINAAMPSRNDAATLVAITTGDHAKTKSAGGKIPHIALWDDYGNRIGQFRPGKNQKMGAGSKGDKKGRIVVKHNQNGNRGADPSYIMLSNHDEDAICISSITVSNGGATSTFYGDTGRICGQSWYYSDRELGETNFKTSCVWLDGDHTGGINAKAMSFHLNDLAPTKSKLDLYSRYPEKGYPYLCQSTPRFSIWGNLLPDGWIPFFDPPLRYTRDGADEGADEDPDRALDKHVYDKSVYLGQGEKKHDRRNNRPGPRKLGKRQNSNMDPGRLIVTQLDGQTAREVCEDPNSAGYDIVSYIDMMYCDISERKLHSICTDNLKSHCFDVNSATLVGHDGPLLTARGEPVKSYESVDHWK